MIDRYQRETLNAIERALESIQREMDRWRWWGSYGGSRNRRGNFPHATPIVVSRQRCTARPAPPRHVVRWSGRAPRHAPRRVTR